ncbi:MAG: TorF family putative porin [Parvularculaceae bacterium]
MIRSSVFALVFSTAAVFSAAAEELTVSTTVGFESRYIFRGVQFAETSFQPTINLGYGNFYGGVWLNLPVGDDDLVVTPGGEELDFTAGYSYEPSGAVSFDVGVTYFTFPDAASGFFDTFEEDGDGMGANTVEPYIGVSFAAPGSPSAYFYHDFMFDTSTFEGSASYSYPLAEKTSFDAGATIGYVIDDDAGGDYVYGSLSGDVSYAVSDASSIAAGLRWGGSDIDGGSFIDDSIAGTFQSSGFWWGIGFSSDF